MRILLQEKDTGLYLKAADTWVRNSLEAQDFMSSTAAIDFCVKQGLSSVQLVLKFEEQRYDIVLPVHPLIPRRDAADTPPRTAAQTSSTSPE